MSELPSIEQDQQQHEEIETYGALRKDATPLGLFIIEQLKAQHLNTTGLALFLGIREDRLRRLMSRVNKRTKFESDELILLSRYFSVSYDTILQHHLGATPHEHEKALLYYQYYLSNTEEQRETLDALNAHYAKQRRQAHKATE